MTNERATGAGISLAPGTKVGKYVVVEMLAVGGQAVVYKARDPLLDRLVAIKQISSTLAADPMFLERFRREAQILARLGAEEAGIVTVHELIEAPEGLFIVMEYLDGITLERSLEDHPEPVEVRAVLAILWRLAASMNAVHKAGIIHRDLKPSNIVVSDGLRVTITDFGVAASSTGQTSMLLGTTKYMAPELFTGQGVDARVDIYSLGLIAYEMLIGRAKFREIFADVVRDPHSESLRWMKWHGNLGVQAPPAAEVNPNVPRPLSDLVVRMMAKKVEERFASMEALGRAIKQNFGGRRGGAAGGLGGVGEALPGGRSVLDDESAPIARPVEAPRAEPKETATAPLPTTKMPLRTKLVIAGVLFVGLLALGVATVFSSGDKQKRALDEAKKTYNAAKAQFDKEDYTHAVDGFSRVVATPGAFEDLKEFKARARVMEALCRGHMQVEKREWQEAAKYYSQVEKDLPDIQRDFKSPEMLQWTATMADPEKGPPGKLDRLTKASMTYESKLKEASGLFKAQKYEQVRDMFTRENMSRWAPNLGNVLGSLKAEGDQLQRKAEHALTAQVVSAAVAEADRLAADKKYKEAAEAYRRAREKVTATKGLSDEEQAAFLKDIDAKTVQMKFEEDYQTWVLKAKTAREQGLPEEELKALRAAAAIKPPADPDKARIAKLQRDMDWAVVETAVADPMRSTEAKIAAADTFVGKYPDDDRAKALLAGLKNEGNRRELVAKGTAAFEAKEWPKAMDFFRQANLIMKEIALEEKITECRYQIKMEQAHALFAEKKYDDALGKAEEARLESPAHLAEVQQFQTLVTSTKNFELLMQQAGHAWQTKMFGQAKDFLERAKKLMPSRAAEADVVLKKVNYSQLISQGDDAVATEAWPSALFMYQRAQKIEDTVEVRGKIADVQSKMGGKTP